MAGERIDFSDPRYHAAPSKRASTADQMTAAELQQKYAAIEAARLAAERARLEADRLRNTPPPQGPKNPAQQATEAFAGRRGQVLGEQVGKAEFSLPQVENTANTALGLVNRLVKHPGFEASVGLPNPFKGGFGPVGTIPGTPARDFKNLLTQTTGGAFMQAREALKGAGQVTDFEGRKAEQAIAAMNEATSEAEFRRAAQDYVNAISSGVAIMRKQAGMGATPYSYEQLMAEKQRRAQGRK